MALVPFWPVDTGGIWRGQTAQVDPNGPIPPGSFSAPPATTGTEVAQWTIAGAWVVLPRDPADTSPDYFSAMGCFAVVQGFYERIARMHDQMVRPAEEPLYAEKVRQARAYADAVAAAAPDPYEGPIPALVLAAVPASTPPEGVAAYASNRATYILGKATARASVMGNLELDRKAVDALALMSPGSDFRDAALDIESNLDSRLNTIIGGGVNGSAGVWP